MGDLGFNSIQHGQGNLYGFIGEIVTNNYLKGKIENTYDYDIVFDKYKIDVKTKCCGSIPKTEYECSIAAYNTEQKCDLYVFTRVSKDLNKCWILGYISKNEFFDKARFCKKGNVDKKSDLSWKFKADCYNMEIRELGDIEKLKLN